MHVRVHFISVLSIVQLHTHVAAKAFVSGSQSSQRHDDVRAQDVRPVGFGRIAALRLEHVPCCFTSPWQPCALPKQPWMATNLQNGLQTHQFSASKRFVVFIITYSSLASTDADKARGNDPAGSCILGILGSELNASVFFCWYE